TTDQYKSDFVFLHSDKESRSALATLSAQYSRVCYTFNTRDDRFDWTEMIPKRDSERRIQYSFLSTSPSGDYALTQRKNSPDKILRIDASKYYQYYFKERKEPAEF